MGVREQVQERMRFKRMRMGQELATMVTIPSMPEVRLAIVPLNEAESVNSTLQAANMDVADNLIGLQLRQRTAAAWDVWQASREPDDLTRKVWASVDEMRAELDPADIDAIFDELTVLMDYASPKLENLSAKDIEELKNSFVLIDWNELSGRHWSALKLCLSLLLPELLAVRLSSTTSTPSSTATSENGEST